MGKRGEFDLIAELFAPLSNLDQGLGLTDDGALFVPQPGHSVVLTTDTLLAGVHYLADDPADSLARKALRVNLSDLAAMGALARGYLLNLAIPSALGDDWLEGFAAGLAIDQRAFGVTLLGGDTVGTVGPGMISITALGEVRIGRALRRSTARPGDDIYVTGTIGDALAGLRVLQGGAALTSAHAEALIDRYRLPRPRTTVGPRLVGLATAAIDVSDGLVADLGHICTTSKVAAVVEADAVPRSEALGAAISSGLLTAVDALGGGDDYELLFCAPPEVREAVRRVSETTKTPIATIGRVVAGSGVRVVGADGADIEIGHPGHVHF
ncbi:MAG: thiamine-phosphate kinase [Alphaproteobacteria bacterium]